MEKNVDHKEDTISFRFNVSKKVAKALKTFSVEPMKAQMVGLDRDNNIVSVTPIEITGFYPLPFKGKKQIPTTFTNKFEITLWVA